MRSPPLVTLATGKLFTHAVSLQSPSEPGLDRHVALLNVTLYIGDVGRLPC